ncbi:hypothetical protein ACYUJ6_10030 [Clostridium sp. JNZ X4-2]
MKKCFKSFILIIFSLILIIGVGCSNAKVANNGNIGTGSEKVINKAISNYIVDYYSHILTNADKVFEAHKVYTMEQKNGLINVYIYTLFEGYAFADGKFGLSCGGSNPALIVLKKDKDKFTVVKFEQPKDGDECGPSIKKMFPNKYAAEAMKDTGRDLGLETEIKLNAKEWLKSQGRSEPLSEE